MTNQMKQKKLKSNQKEFMSHLYLNGKDLEKLENKFAPYKNLIVLYLHQNKLESLDNLNDLKNLTHLYLQWNNLKKIENIDQLHKLQKLYLGHNEISRLENVENLKNLRELHIENQRIDTEFTFDIESLNGLANNLETLNVAQLHLTSITPLQNLQFLRTLIATGNSFETPEDIACDLDNFRSLRNLSTYDCPAQKDVHYRIKITAGAYNLEFLDGKFISKTSRIFIKEMEKNKIEQKLSAIRKKSSEKQVIEKDELGRKVEASKKSVTFDVLNSRKSAGDLGYQSWNSLNTVQKPMKSMMKKSMNELNPEEYRLQGKNFY